MRTIILAVVVVIFGCSFAIGQVQEKLLYSFSGPDGAQPFGKLMFDNAGNLYGTTKWGGSQGWGTVFELSPGPDGTWTESVLYSFCQDFEGGSCVDGGEPLAGLVMDSAGNLFGTTWTGGGFCPHASEGCGTVFQLSPPLAPGAEWQETVLYKFCQQGDIRCPDGSFPYDKLTFDPAGNLFGTTSGGGGGGLVFELSPSPSGWTETVLYTFCSLGQFPVCPDGDEPQSAVTLDNSGNIYGTTVNGGSPKYEGGGVVYKLSPSQSGWTETVLHSFNISTKGFLLMGSINIDSDGNLYSTAFQGGESNEGVVFQLSQKNGGTQRTFSFSGTNGGNPTAGVLIDPRNGNLYGTTSTGGVNGCTYGCGTVYKINGKGETVIYAFFGGQDGDGAFPMAGLEADKKGHLYGTTALGGATNQGTIFEIIP